MAATILLSLMPPVTLTVTFGCSLLYSAATLLKTFSSRALQPTHTFRVTGLLSGVDLAALPELLELFEPEPFEPPPQPTIATAASAIATDAVATRLITRT